MRPAVLTIAGTDSSGGAGVVADVRTFTALEVWSLVCVTAVTAQGDGGVSAVSLMDPEVVAAQLRSVAGAAACKTGMLGSADIVMAVAAGLPAGAALVIDPVLVASSGRALLSDEGAKALVEALVPKAAVVTPNLDEARLLTGEEDQVEAGRALLAMGAGAALVTGGHGPGAEIADVLVAGGGEPVWFRAPRLSGGMHGTGCVLSAAITANLANAMPLQTACDRAIGFTRRAISMGTGSADPAWGLTSL